MKVVWVASSYAHEQPSPAVWDLLVGEMRAWNLHEPEPVDLSQPYAGVGVFEAESACARFVQRLGAVEGAVIRVDPSNRLEATDLETAEFVCVFAVPEEGEVVTNADRALRPNGPCPECGLEDSFDVTQVAPFVVGPVSAGTEAVNLPGGGLMVSKGFADDWAAAGVTGYETEVLLSPSDSSPVPSWRQLVATTAVLLPCPVHTEVRGEAHCPVCGRARGQVVGPTWVQAEQVDGLDVVARHPGRRAMIAVSRRALDVVRDRPGLDLVDVFRVCQH